MGCAAVGGVEYEILPFDCAVVITLINVVLFISMKHCLAIETLFSLFGMCYQRDCQVQSAVIFVIFMIFFLSFSLICVFVTTVRGI